MASNADWEAIEHEFRAGQLSTREIARRYGISEKAIRKRVERDGWQRDLADKVRRSVRETLVRTDGSAVGPHASRTRTDAEIVRVHAETGANVVLSHRKDIGQLHALKRILADRLSQHLDGLIVDGPLMGERESPSDVLEKLSRITVRLIPLERQAFNLDAETGDDPQAHARKIKAALDEIEAAADGPSAA